MPPLCSYEDEGVGVVDQDVDSFFSSTRIHPLITYDKDADSFFSSTRIRPLITQYIASCTPPFEELMNSPFRDIFFVSGHIAMVLL